MTDVTVTGFGEGIMSWVSTPEGVTILVTDGTNPNLSVRLLLTRQELRQLLTASDRAATGERMIPHSVDTN